MKIASNNRELRITANLNESTVFIRGRQHFQQKKIAALRLCYVIKVEFIAMEGFPLTNNLTSQIFYL